MHSNFSCENCFKVLNDFSSFRQKILKKHQKFREFRFSTNFVDIKPNRNDKLEPPDSQPLNFEPVLIKTEFSDGNENIYETQQDEVRQAAVIQLKRLEASSRPSR